MFVIFDVVDAQGLTEYFGAVEIVYGQYGAALILVQEEAEAPALADLRRLSLCRCAAFPLQLPLLLLSRVPREIDIDDLPILREYRENITLSESGIESPDENDCAVFVLVVPGSPRGAIAADAFELVLVEALYRTDVAGLEAGGQPFVRIRNCRPLPHHLEPVRNSLHDLLLDSLDLKMYRKVPSPSGVVFLSVRHKLVRWLARATLLLPTASRDNGSETSDK